MTPVPFNLPTRASAPGGTYTALDGETKQVIQQLLRDVDNAPQNITGSVIGFKLRQKEIVVRPWNQ